MKGGEKMRKAITLFMSLFLLIINTAWAGLIEDLHKFILYPTVRIRTESSIGSGTIIASIRNENKYETYVLTNHHVIRDAIQIIEEWDSIKKEMVKKEKRATVEVEQFKYQNLSINTGTLLILSDIVAWNKDHDLALIKLRSDDYFQPAKILAPNKIDSLRIFQEIIVSGCGNGRSPFPTFGIIASLQDEIENQPYWMVTAPSVFGNSGGGSFLKETMEFIGIPSRLSVTFVGWSPNAVYHMCYIIPISRIYKWLEEIGYGFIFIPK